MYVSTKPTIYLIDGLNLVRSFLYEFARTEEEVTADFWTFWLISRKTSITQCTNTK